ncbi:MAG: TetR/AcrR family transcriptional regulator [Spirochaetia bacterium]
MSKDMRFRILAGAQRLFFNRGLQVKIDEIASYLGISKKTIYNHFKSKQDLIDNMVEQEVAHLLGELDRISADKSVGFGERLLRLSEFAVEEMGRRGLSLIRNIRENESRFREGLFPLVREKIERLVSSLVDEGLEKGFVREDIDREMVGPVYVGMLEGVLRLCGQEGKEVPVGRLLSANLKFLLQGILKPEHQRDTRGAKQQ